MATVREVRQWVEDPTRTLADLQGAYAALGLAAPAPGDYTTLRTALVNNLAARRQDEIAPWAPALPAPVPVPVPVAPPAPPQVTVNNQIGPLWPLWVIGGIVAAVLLGALVLGIVMATRSPATPVPPTPIVVTGPAGPQGPQGPQGLVGPQGPAGKDGRDGKDGSIGPQGPVGPAGKDGKDGSASSTSAQGTPLNLNLTINLSDQTAQAQTALTNHAQVIAGTDTLTTTVVTNTGALQTGGMITNTGALSQTGMLTNVVVAPTCTFPAPGNLDAMPKLLFELVQPNTWTHRVFNVRDFHAPNWGGADSWFVTLALGQNSGGNWTSFGNPGQIVYRATSTNISWCLGVLTTGQWKSQFMDNSTTMPAAVNVRIAPNSLVTVVTNTGKTVSQTTSDQGDITIVLPDNGTITISVSYNTAAPTHESLVWWGPLDRTKNINLLDAR